MKTEFIFSQRRKAESTYSASLSPFGEVPSVKAVSADSLTSIEGKFVLVVGDRELAERLKVGYLTEEEARELLGYIKKRLKEEAS